MQNHIKSSVKVLTGYLSSLLVFGIFLYVFLTLTKENFSAWLPLYSFLNFLLLYSLLYSDFKKLAIKEKNPDYNLKPYPLKGFVLGVMGFLPVIVLELAYAVYTMYASNYRVAEVTLKTILGPIYWIVRLVGINVYGYAAATLSVPVIVMLGYLAGYYGFEAEKYFKFLKKKQLEKPKGFEKSPWNPTVANKGKTGTKKKK